MNDEDDYWKAASIEIETELDKFEKYILPIFISRGYSKTAALEYYSNRQVEEAVDELIDRVDTNTSGNEDEPWKN